mgnify:FL=1
MFSIKPILKEPLLHFLAMGLALFLIYESLNPGSDEDNSSHILIDRDTLLTYMQVRAKAFNGEHFQQQLNAMPEPQRQSLINDYVREEVLYREAKALQLDKNDALARQRMIQQMRYVMQSMIGAAINLTEEDLQKYQTLHADRYAEPATITFTHVFINADTRSMDKAKSLAQQQLKTLNQEQIQFHQAPGHGDRFLYHRNYVQKEADLVASHFGEALQAAVFNLAPNETQWQGPFVSPYGYHLVLVTQQTPERHPAFNEVKARITQDLMRERRQQQVDATIKGMIERYEVTVALEPELDPELDPEQKQNPATLAEGA